MVRCECCNYPIPSASPEGRCSWCRLTNGALLEPPSEDGRHVCHIACGIVPGDCPVAWDKRDGSY